MNKTDVVTQVSQKMGIAADVCEKVVKAFEEQAGDALIGKFSETLFFDSVLHY